MKKEEIKLIKLETEIEYKAIPEHVLQAAAERGKNFHKIIQDFFQDGNYPPFVDEKETIYLNKLDSKVHETLNFLKKNKSLELGRFLGSEKLYYIFHKGELLAAYIDLEFQNHIIELKTNSIKTNDRVVFSKFEVSESSLKILDILLDFARCYNSGHNFDDLSVVKVSPLVVTLGNVRADYSSLQNQRDTLQVEKSNFQSRVSDLQVANARLDARNDSLLSENTNLQSLIRAGERELATKNNQINEKDRQIVSYSTQLTTTQNQLTAKNNELVAKQNQYDELIRQFTALQITINNKDNEIEEKVNKIKELKGDLNISREEFLNQKIDLKEEKLGEFIQQFQPLGVNQGQTRNLQDFYEQLKVITTSPDYNRDNARAVENNINTIEQALLNAGVSVVDTRKVLRKCKKIANLKIELDQVYQQQQYEARQEVPPHQ
ncbi:16719_t:CDS:2 [Entrophospora sp. SA101]|nr:16719_t:CDS:2 [Entrophospora sp. SA101]CAJ0925027.1 7384_t:CDS:2 [Entrophospora sp. SA101]